MSFIVLRRSRNTKSYYLVESYRDETGKARKHTLCYLGREQDGTDTIGKALAHWEQVSEQARTESRTAKGKRKTVLKKRRDAASARVALLKAQLAQLAASEAVRKQRELEAEEALHWQAFDRLRRFPNDENAQAAKRAFLLLAKRYHPDLGGSHQDFLRLKDTYDRAKSAWR